MRLRSTRSHAVGTWTATAVLVLSTAAVTGCVHGSAAPPASAARARAPESPGAAPSGSAGPSVVEAHPASEPAAAPPFARDALWDAAIAGDHVDLHRLAQREGALALVSATRQGGEVRVAALRALPLAEDVAVGLAPVCHMLVPGEPGVAEVLRSIHQIAAQPPDDTERLDPDAPAACRLRLSKLVQGGLSSDVLRDLALSAERLFYEPAWGGPVPQPPKPGQAP